MGVLGLWQVLESVGHPIKLDALEGKKFAIDANIWLYKFIRGSRDKDGHKLGLFNRVCKLLFYKIKPVFVFDGPAPILKRRTLERRQNVRSKQLEKVQEAAMSLIAKQLKDQYPDANLDEVTIKLPDLRSHALVAAEKLNDDDRELFYLPPEVIDVDVDDEEYSDDDEEEEVEVKVVDRKPDIKSISFEDYGDGVCDVDYKPPVDIESQEFKEMPAEIRYEILQELKESRKRIRRANALPEDANSFSKLQLERLKSRRAVQEKIEQSEKDICSMYTGTAYRIHSDSSSTMLYLKNSISEPKPSVSQTSQKHDDSIDWSVPTQTKHEPISPLKVASLIKTPVKTPENKVLRIFSQRYKKNLPNLTDTNVRLSPDSNEEEEVHKDDVSVNTQLKSNSPIKLSESDHSDESSSSTEIELETEIEQEAELIESKEKEIVYHIDSDDDLDHSTSKPELTTKTNNTILIDSSELDLSPQKSELELLSPNSESNKLPNQTILIDSDTDSDSFEPCEPETKVPEKVSVTPTQDIIQKDNEPKNSEIEQPPKTQGEELKKKGVTHTIEQLLGVDDNLESDTKRLTNRVTTKIVEEAKELLTLFGIPYIDAAGEAEAQCALLEQLGLTEGTITDDSDVWLFGAKNVLRYFFSDDKYVMQYKMPEIEYHLRLNRELLVCFAMLVGSDYTDGIMNVGPVTALEIIAEFPGEGMEPLIKFKSWKDKYEKSKDRIPGSKKRENLLKYKLPDEFPSKTVFEGYTRPVADTSEEQFSWGLPELDELREYARKNFGWEKKKIDDKLLPVMKKLNERQTQTKLDSYFFKTAANQNPEMFRSKRVNQALKKMSKTDDNEEEPDKKETAKKSPGKRPKKKKISKTEEEPDKNETVKRTSGKRLKKKKKD